MAAIAVGPAYRPADQATSPAFHRIGAVAVIARAGWFVVGVTKNG